jgi:hypothetical protein
MSARPPFAPSTIVALAVSALLGTAVVVAAVDSPTPRHVTATPGGAPAFPTTIKSDPSLPSAASVVTGDERVDEPAPTF